MWFYLFIFGQKKGDPSVLLQSSQQDRRWCSIFSLLSNVCARVAVMGMADRQDMARYIPKFATDLAGKNCMKAFPWQQWLWWRWQPQRRSSRELPLSLPCSNPEVSMSRPTLPVSHEAQGSVAGCLPSCSGVLWFAAAKPAGRSASWAENILWDLSKINSWFYMGEAEILQLHLLPWQRRNPPSSQCLSKFLCMCKVISLDYFPKFKAWILLPWVLMDV